MAWLGHRGRLAELDGFASDTVVESRKRFRESMTIDGNRYIQALPTQSREWNVLPGFIDSVHRRTLEDFINGLWGIGPWVWISDLALAGNMLTPRQSSFQGPIPGAVTRTGAMQDYDGAWAPQTLTAYTGVHDLPWEIDLPPMDYLNVQAHAQGTISTAPQIRVKVYNSYDPNPMKEQIILGEIGATMQNIGAVVALPMGATYATLSIHGMFARMWVTNSHDPSDYVTGQGCPKAVIDTAARGVALLSSCGSIISQMDSVLIREVGDRT